ncbi:DNA glycosylase [Penicillium maclennaniae]|uniref:DNA glycosylase n=1 Tax=Penicillium maclennaniae TaxID=1343394 RepID=UPI0025419FE0|nr:DNA glycosylase [Penicillium maclennaniae]KAJ5665734.1 DNA glycosylase [Penicillium maclennaniae]
MSLRRSARLGSIPSIKAQLPATVKVTRVPTNGITKPRKASTVKKAASRASTDPQSNTESSYWSPEPPTGLSTNVTAYPSRLEDASPSKTGMPPPLATTGTLLEQATAHLIATDPRLKSVIEQHPCSLFSPAGLAEQIDPFNSLVSSIIGQQVSGAAAKSIRNKFLALFNIDDPAGIAHSRFPLPAEVANVDLPTLRTAGLSQRKAEYIQGLAEKFASGELSARMLAKASDEELLEKLIAVRGLGKWSVEMFAMFALKRTDVFSTGDLGVQRGCAAFVGRDVTKLKGKGGGKFKYMAEKDMLELAAKFSPYRSLFMWYMWRIEDVDIAVNEEIDLYSISTLHLN